MVMKKKKKKKPLPLATEVVVGERDGGGDDNGVGEMRERRKF